MGILEKIKEIEHEMARTQKNKATEYHLGLLKAKLAKYRRELIEVPKSQGAKVHDLHSLVSDFDRVNHLM